MLTFSRTEYPIDSVFLLQDLDTQRIYQLHGLSMPSSSGPSWPTVERARSKGACRLDVVIESVQLDIQHAEFSNHSCSCRRRRRVGYLLNGGSPNSAPTRLRYLTRCRAVVCDGIEIGEVIDRKTGRNAVILFQA